MCTAPKPPSYQAPKPPKAPSPSQLANEQSGNVLTQYANQSLGQFGLKSYKAAKAAGLQDWQIKNLLPTSGISTLGAKAAAALGMQAGPILNPAQQMQAQYEAQQAKQYAIAKQQYDQQVALQKSQFEQSLAAQEKALQAQLSQQDALAKKSEEAALKAQVPQLTANRNGATRIRATSESRKAAKAAAQGTSRLRIPLSISNSGSMSGLTNSSPVKLNIG